MDWLTKLDEPFFRSREEADAFVTRELAQTVPQGWRVNRPLDERLTWVIQKVELEPGEWFDQDYTLRVSDGLDFVIFTCGNSDEGPFCLRHVLLNALVIESVMLRAFSLSDCLRFLFAGQKPNQSCCT